MYSDRKWVIFNKLLLLWNSEIRKNIGIFKKLIFLIIEDKSPSKIVTPCF